MAIWAEGSRQDLGVLLEHVQDNADRLTGDALMRLALAMERMSAAGTLDLDKLSQLDINELWALVRDVASENGKVWEVTDGND